MELLQRAIFQTAAMKSLDPTLVTTNLGSGFLLTLFSSQTTISEITIFAQNKGLSCVDLYFNISQNLGFICISQCLYDYDRLSVILKLMFSQMLFFFQHQSAAVEMNKTQQVLHLSLWTKTLLIARRVYICTRARVCVLTKYTYLFTPFWPLLIPIHRWIRRDMSVFIHTLTNMHTHRC